MSYLTYLPEPTPAEGDKTQTNITFRLPWTMYVEAKLMVKKNYGWDLSKFLRALLKDALLNQDLLLEKRLSKQELWQKSKENWIHEIK